jgi:anti-anti-sigma regulatory factor
MYQQTDYPSKTASGQRSVRSARKLSASMPKIVPPGAASSFQTAAGDPRRAITPDSKKIVLAGGHSSRKGGLSSEFSTSKLNAFQVGEFVHDPQLEEAAIRFANGDDDGAEAALLEALANPDPTVNGNPVIWMTLFDLYRATDRQEAFENASLDFANRFGHTAPLWFSIPGNIRHHSPAFVESSAELTPHWKSPASLDVPSLALMKASLDKAPQPWCLSWLNLEAVDAAALDMLYRLFTCWTDESVKLRFFGAEHLLSVLKILTPTGDTTIDPLIWRIRMQVLRIMHRPDEFEVVALDYCVTYEVSPPSWDSALCNFRSLDASSHTLISAPSIVAESAHDGVPSSLPPEEFTETERTAIAALGSHVSAVDLSGHIMGDAVEMLDTLNAKLEGTDLIIVLCSRLIRLDFLAAGTLLNWVSTQQAEGRQVQFKDLHRLVAVFFNIIGINEHAKVIARTD